MPSEKLTPRTPFVEVLARLEAREISQDAEATFQDGIKRMRPAWEYLEQRRVSMTDTLRIIRKRRTGVWSDVSTDVGAAPDVDAAPERVPDPPTKKRGATDAPLFAGCAQERWKVRTVGAYEDPDFDEDGLSQGMTPEEFRAYERKDTMKLEAQNEAREQTVKNLKMA